MRLLLISLCLLLCVAPPVAASDWADATPTAWHRLARAESLLTAPEPSNPVAVCVVDSGVNLTPDLEPVVIERLAYDGGDPGDTYPQEGIDDGHGTYVATFLAGQVNGWGGAGLWPRARIVSVRVFPPGGKRARAADYAEALSVCTQRSDVKVINLSLSDIDASPEEVAELEQRVAHHRQHDINIVAAAGNRGGGVEIPARFGAAVAVGASDGQDRLCPFSARGPELDIVAPGCDLAGADQRGSQVAFAGTSFSAPMVAATLAALRAYGGMNAEQAEERMMASARLVNGVALLDATAALSTSVEHWSPRREQPILTPIADAGSMPRSDFADYPAPRARTRWRRRRNCVITRITNRPAAASVEVRRRGRTLHFARSLFVVCGVKPQTRLAARFISDVGFSSWARLVVRR